MVAIGPQPAHRHTSWWVHASYTSHATLVTHASHAGHINDATLVTRANHASHDGPTSHATLVTQYSCKSCWLIMLVTLIWFLMLFMTHSTYFIHSTYSTSRPGNDDHTNDRIDPILDLFLQVITISILIRSDPQSKCQERHSRYFGHGTLFSRPTSNLNNSGRVCPIYLKIGELRVHYGHS